MFLIYIGLASVLLSILLLLGLGKLLPAQGGLTAATASKPGFRPIHRWGLVGISLLAVVASVVFLSNATEQPGPAAAQSKAPHGGQAAPGQAAGGLDTVVNKLAEKMAADPNNGEGWLLLAKTYYELQKFAEADAAYAKGAALMTLDAPTLADWADAHAASKNAQWDAEGRKLVERALAADPRNAKALALSGSEAFDRGDYKAAIDFWTRLKAVPFTELMDSRILDGNIEEAKARLTGAKPAGDAKSAGPAPKSATVAGVVTLNPALQGKVSPNDTIFVTAKAPDGAGAPLAVWRYKGSDFPIEFRLDDSSAILPGRTISQFPEVLVTAKVSKTGNAEPGKGDILAAPVKAKLGNTTLVVELNAER